jgi:hypothetical protein
MVFLLEVERSEPVSKAQLLPELHQHSNLPMELQLILVQAAEFPQYRLG